jgi:hypothetical protein
MCLEDILTAGEYGKQLLACLKNEEVFCYLFHFEIVLNVMSCHFVI